MKKKVLSLMLCGAMVAGMVTGCGSSDSSSTGSSDADPNTLTVYAWDANFNIPALEAAEKAYQKKNPDFKLVIEEQSKSQDVEDAVTLAGSSGDYSTLPDIVLFQDHYIQQFVANYPDAWKDVEDAGIDWNDFGAEKISYSTIDGKHYGVPVDNGTVVFAYNTEALAAAGYTIDDVTGITWDEFDEIGKAVKAATGKYLLSMDGNGNDLFYMMLQAEGVSQFKDGEPNLVGNQTVTDIVTVINKLCTDGVLLLANDWGGYTDETIIGDQVAGVMNGNWIIPTIEQVEANSGKWEITTMPTLTGAEGYAANGGSSLYITGNCQNVELAQDFLAYTFGGGEGAIETYDAALKNGGVITTCISAGQSDVYQEGVAYFNDQAIYAKIVEMGSHVPVIEQSDYHYQVREQLSTVIVKINNGEVSVEDGIKEAEEALRFNMGL